MGKLKINAKDAIAQVKALVIQINAIKSASSNMNKANKANFAALEANVKNLKSTIALLGNRINYLSANYKSLVATQTASTSATKRNSSAKLKNVAATNASANSNKKLDLSIRGLLKAGGLLSLVTNLGFLALNVFKNIKTFDSLSFTLEKITKTSFDYENSQRFLLKITQDYGVELVSTTLRWSRFLAAAKESGLSLRDTENIFESMTKAAATLGLKTDELASVYLALEQMLSKGKVSTEELRRQLGERLPGAMGIMAASMGVTIPVLDKMLKKGEVLSAEVLPNFAKAVERAYGIENADRIETLVSKQNRLTASWQTFIKNISEGDSVIKKVLGGFLELLNETIDGWARIFATGEQELRIKIIADEKEFKESLKKSAANFVELTTNGNEQNKALDIRKKNLEARLKTATGEEIKLIKDSLDEILAIRIRKDKEAEEISKKNAAKQLDEKYKNFVTARAKYDDLVDKFEAKKEELSKTKPGASFFLGEDKELKSAQNQLSKATAEYNIYRKLVEESDVQFIDDETVTKTQRNLRAIKDFTIKTANEIAAISLNANKDIVGDETIDLRKRLSAIKESARLETFIRKNEFEIQKKDVEDSLAKELKSLENSVSKGNLTREKFIARQKELEDEKNAHIKFEATRLLDDLLKLNNKFAKQSKEITFNTTSQSREDIVKDKFSKQLIAAKKVFNASKKTAADKERLDKESARIAIEAANSVIQVKIRILKEEIKILEKSGEENSEYISKLKREVNSLEASMQIKATLDTADWDKVFDESMDLAQAFTSSIGELVDSVFERKLEYIDAEIAAEEEKYDRLIALAEGDDEQQATLERNKEERLKQLDKKRLDQEQKQAKARKKFALADIAISTARAIIGIWADFPKDDYGITAGIMSGVVAALGAAQAATVIAQPIPQYKDGVENLSENQKAMINDGAFKEYVERNGRILSTDKKNAVVDLKKGDTVYKNYDEMSSKSELFKIKNIRAYASREEGKLLKDVTKAVSDGFKKAKNINNINLETSSNDNYKSSISRWSN